MFSFYLKFYKNCKETLKFYEKVFGTNAYNVIENEEMVFHSKLDAYGHTFILSDDSEEIIQGNNFILTLTLSTTEEVEKCYEVLKEDASIIFDIGPVKFPGEEFSCHFHLKDKFGILWTVLAK